MSDESIFKDIVQLSVDVTDFIKGTKAIASNWDATLRQMGYDNDTALAARRLAANATALAERRINDETRAQFVDGVEQSLRKARGLSNKYDDEAKAQAIKRQAADDNLMRASLARTAENNAIRLQMFADEKAQEARIAQQALVKTPVVPGLGVGGGHGMTLPGLASSVYLLEKAYRLADSIVSPINDYNQQLHNMEGFLKAAVPPTADLGLEIHKLADAAMRVSQTFNRDTKEVLEGFKLAISVGIKPEEVEQFSNVAGRFAAAVGTTFKTSSDMLTDIRDAWHLNVSDMTHVANSFFVAMTRGKIAPEELTRSMGRLNPAAVAAGISFDDAAVGLATLTANGMTTSQAVTALSQTILGILKPSKQAEKAFIELSKATGIALNTGTAAFAGRNLLDVLRDIEKATKGSADEMLKLFPDRRSSSGFISMEKSLNTVQGLNDAIKDLSRVDDAAALSMDTLGTKTGRMFEMMKNAALRAGDAIFDAFNKVANGPKKGSFLADAFDALSPKDHSNETPSWMPKAATPDVKAAILDNINTPFQATLETLENANKELEKFQKAAQRRQDQEVSSRQTKEQKQQILDMEEKLSQLEENRAQASAYVQNKEIGSSSNVNPVDLHRLQDQLLLARDAVPAGAGREQKLQALNVEYIAKMKELADASMSRLDMQFKATAARIFGFNLDTDGDRINVLKHQIEELKAVIEKQPTNASREDAAKEQAKEVEFLDKRHREFASKAKQIETETYNEFKRLYDKDKSEFEKAQRQKEAALKHINKDIESSQASHTARMERIQQQLDAAKMASAHGDLGAQRRIANSEKEHAESSLSTFMAGGGTDEKEFGVLLSSFLKATEALTHIAEEDSKGSGGRKAQGFAQEAFGFETTFSKRIAERNAQLQSEAQIRAAKSNVPALDSIAAQAVKNVNEKKTVEKRLIETTVKVQVDGSLSEQTKKDLATAIITQIHSQDEHQDGYNQYPQETFAGDDGVSE